MCVAGLRIGHMNISIYGGRRERTNTPVFARSRACGESQAPVLSINDRAPHDAWHACSRSFGQHYGIMRESRPTAHSLRTLCSKCHPLLCCRCCISYACVAYERTGGDSFTRDPKRIGHFRALARFPVKSVPDIFGSRCAPPPHSSHIIFGLFILYAIFGASPQREYIEIYMGIRQSSSRPPLAAEIEWKLPCRVGSRFFFVGCVLFGAAAPDADAGAIYICCFSSRAASPLM